MIVVTIPKYLFHIILNDSVFKIVTVSWTVYSAVDSVKGNTFIKSLVDGRSGFRKNVNLMTSESSTITMIIIKEYYARAVTRDKRWKRTRLEVRYFVTCEWQTTVEIDRPTTSGIGVKWTETDKCALAANALNTQIRS